jgi:hypothetical protein
LSRRFTTEYPSSAALSITLNGLANAAARACLAVSNTTDKHQDALVQVKFAVVAGTPGGEYRALIYAYGSEDGTNFTSPCTGVDEAVSVTTSTPTLALLGEVEVRTANSAYVSSPLSIAKAFGWAMPRKWGIVVVNRTNLAFAGSGCSASYTGVYGGLQ